MLPGDQVGHPVVIDYPVPILTHLSEIMPGAVEKDSQSFIIYRGIVATSDTTEEPSYLVKYDIYGNDGTELDLARENTWPSMSIMIDGYIMYVIAEEVIPGED